MDPDEPLEVPAAAAFHPDARTKQVCFEYERLLAAALAGDIDPRLRDVTLLEIAPHPDVRSVLVVIVAPTELHTAVEEALDAATARLRDALRREAEGREGPELTFRLESPVAESS